MTTTTACSRGLPTALADFEPWGGMLCIGDASAGRRVLASAQMLEPTAIRRSVDALAERLGADDHRAVASTWCKYYEAAVVTGVLAAAVLRGVGLDASLPRTGIVLREGLPCALWLPPDAEAVFLRERWPAACGEPPRLGREAAGAEALQRFVWQGVFAEHLQPMVQRVSEATGVRPRILWANIGSRCAYLFDAFAAHAPLASDADRHSLLGSREVAWAEGRNPLHAPVRYECLATDAGPVRAQVRKTCCLRDRLPGAALCANCPRLTPEQRAQRLTAKDNA